MYNIISESDIEQTLTWLEADPQQFEQAIDQLKEEQPQILAYLFSAAFDILTQNEKDLLLYLTIVIFLTYKQAREKLPIIDQDKIEETEEHNYTLFELTKAIEFRDRLDIFFENYPQEDLLAFVEDALTDEEEEQISKTGRAPMFIALKTIIDVLN